MDNMVDVHMTINGCRVYLQHEDADQARRTAGNLKVMLADAGAWDAKKGNREE